MRAGTPGGSATRVITVLSASRATSQKVGPLAWVVLEELALRAEPEADGFAVETSVRDLATSVVSGKDATATALARLVDLGLVHCRTRRRAGRYAGCTYVLDPDACRRAGLILTVAIEAPPGAVAPC